MKGKNFISILFYYRNADRYISDFFGKLIPVMDNNFDNYELICVDNESKSESIGKLKEYHAQHCPNVPMTVISLPYCKSIEEAMVVGIDMAIGDFIYEFDNILIDYEPDQIKHCFDVCVSGKDVVMLCPNSKVTAKQRLYYGLYNFGVAKDKRIYPIRFKLFSRRAINRVEKISEGGFNTAATISNCGLDFENVFYKPSKNYIKYDREELKERVNKGVETLIMNTNSLQKLTLIGSVLCGIAGVARMLSSKEDRVGLPLLIIACQGISSCTIISYLSTVISVKSKKDLRLVKNIEKVIGQ